MPVEFDSPAPTRSGVVFDDAPKGGVVFDTPDPYAGIVNQTEQDRINQEFLATAADRYGAAPANSPATLGQRQGYTPSTAAKLALRVGVPLTVGLGTGGLGLLPALALAGGTGLATEAAAEGLEIAGGERESLSPTQIAATGLLNTVPALPLTRIASPLIRGGIRVAEGAGLGAAYPVLEAGLRGELPNVEDVKTGALYGGLIGAPFGGLELARGRTFGRAATDILPTELTPVGQAMREPLPVPEPIAPSLTPTNLAIPTELAVPGAIRQQVAAEQASRNIATAEAQTAAQEASSAARIKALGERMMGKPPEQQLQVLDQELRLQKDYLTDAEQRAGLDLKQELQRQIEQQRAFETAAKEEQRGIADQQKALADVQEASQLAAPEVPKSTQIVDEVNAPKSLANAAAIGAKQAEGNLNQLQAQINEVVVAPLATPEVTQAVVEPANIGDRSGRPTGAAEEAVVVEQRKALGLDENNKPIAAEGTSRVIPEPPKAPDFARATNEQVYQWADELRAYDRNIDVAILGEDGAKEHRRLTRISDSPNLSAGDPKIKDALAKLAVIENALTPEQQNAFYGINLPKDHINFEDARDIRRSVNDIDTSDTIAELTRSSSKIIQKGLRASTGNGDPLSVVDSQLFMRVLSRAKEIDSSPQKFIEEYFRYRSRFEGDDVFELAGTTPEKVAKFFGETKRPVSGLPEPGVVDIGTEIPRTQEQRLNDADLNLPPVSSLSRAAKRAELDAAGVTTYKGKPLDDINPAELSSAVGKLRRGESLDLPPTDIIDRLTKAKIKTAGRTYDATAGIPIAAYNAAIDTAIVAIRAGRALVEVVAMAIDRYRKMHPNATPDEITRLSQDIEVAHGLGEPTPGRTEAEQIVADAPALDVSQGRPPEATQAASRMRQTRGAINPSVLGPVTGAGIGATYGATQGNSPEERIRNATLYGALGLGAGHISGNLINKAISKPIRNYASQNLKDVAQMLTPLEEKTSLFEKLSDAYGNFRYRFNTKFAPIGDAQRALYKEVGRTFTPSRYYDLERGFERLAGAPVQAEGEVELLQHVIDKLPKQDVPHLDTYLTLSRIEDRLIKTSEENARLQDAVGIAQAELESADAAYRANPKLKTAASRASRTEALNAANKKLSEDFNRKRVGDWSIAKAQQGLQDLQAEIGPDAFARLQTAGQEYQDVMRRALQIQVDSGRMSRTLMNQVLDSNDFYAPFKVLKYFEENEGFVKGAGQNRIPSSEQLVKKITGIDDPDVRIGSPTNVAAEQVYKGYILAQKNRKLRELATLARLDKDGDYIKPLAPEMEPRKGYEAVSYFVNGEPRRLEVSRPIANALTGLDAVQTDIVLDVLGKTAGAFKLGATGLNIPFNISNALVFDPIRLATMSRYGFRGPQDFLYTMYEWPKALFSSARGNLGQPIGIQPDALYEQWIKSGAANSTLARQLTPEAFASRLPKDMKTGEVVAESNFGLGAPIKVAALLSNTLEETTKLLGLQRAVRLERLDKLTPAQREKKWDEIVTEIRNYSGSPDFARAGVSMRPLNIVLPFLNARWQGAINDVSRLNPFRQGNASDAGAAWARLTTLVGIPAASLAYYNFSTPQNEKDYLQIPKQERERYFHIPLQTNPDGTPTILDTGKGYYFKNKDGATIRGYYRIPKREFTGLMANTIEDFMEYTKGTHPETFAQMAANFGDNTVQTISPINLQGDTAQERFMSAASGLNPLVRAPLEIGTNKNFFTGRDIVPENTLKASPEKQYGSNTPQGYVDFADAAPDFLPNALRSPAQLQHLTESFTGGFSRQFATPRLSEGNPAGGSSPLVGRFYRSERVEAEDMLKAANEAERGRADQRLDAQRISQKLTEIIQSKATPEEKQKVLRDAAASGLLAPDVQQYLKEDLTDASRGLTYEDRVVKRSYSVAGGFRAQYYLKKLAELQPAERAAYLQDQANKGLLSREVQGQLGALTAARP